MNTHYFECKCHSDEHTIKFSYDEEDNELYLSVFLNQYRNLFKRIWVAFRYVMGYKCRYGNWDCTLFKDEDIKSLLKLIREVENANFWIEIEKSCKEDTYVKKNNNNNS